MSLDIWNLYKEFFLLKNYYFIIDGYNSKDRNTLIKHSHQYIQSIQIFQKLKVEEEKKDLFINMLITLCHFNFYKFDLILIDWYDLYSLYVDWY